MATGYCYARRRISVAGFEHAPWRSSAGDDTPHHLSQEPPRFATSICGPVEKVGWHVGSLWRRWTRYHTCDPVLTRSPHISRARWTCHPAHVDAGTQRSVHSLHAWLQVVQLALVPAEADSDSPLSAYSVNHRPRRRRGGHHGPLVIAVGEERTFGRGLLWGCAPLTTCLRRRGCRGHPWRTASAAGNHGTVPSAPDLDRRRPTDPDRKCMAGCCCAPLVVRVSLSPSLLPMRHRMTATLAPNFCAAILSDKFQRWSFAPWSVNRSRSALARSSLASGQDVPRVVPKPW